MKAILLRAYGGPELLEMSSLDPPRPAPDELVLKVAGAGVNPVDWRRRSGQFASAGDAFPMILGNAVSGVVVAAGSACCEFPEGIAVIARCSGGYAEFVSIKIDAAARAPSTIPLVSAARIPVAAGAAWLYLFEAGALQPGELILIHGASGAVGQFAVQLARLAGARVMTTSRALHFDKLRALGAEHCFDSGGHEWKERRDVDLVFNAVGGELRSPSWNVLKPGATLVSLVGPADALEAARRGVVATNSRRDVNGALLANLVSLIDAGAIAVPDGPEIALAEAAEAHRMGEGRLARGPIVLRPDG